MPKSREKDLEYGRAKRARRKAEGKCRECEALRLPGKSLCDEHMKRQQAYYKDNFKTVKGAT